MMRKLTEVFLVFLRLGLTSFGGPIAHLGFFHDEFVKRRHWISEQSYGDLVSLCQFLPGPASSQVGMAIGMMRAGYFGALVAWLGFTLPSAILLTLFGLGISHYEMADSWLHGLKIVAVAVVAQALWGMAAKLCPDKPRAIIAVSAAVIVTVAASAVVQLVVLALGGMLGICLLGQQQDAPHTPLGSTGSRKIGAALLSIFSALIVVLPLIARTLEIQSVKLFDSFFRAGSLVFGGGHVILPLLQAEVVPPGWVSKEMFMAGYGAAQAIPGPLFSFSAYLGAISSFQPAGWTGAFICLIAAFLPSFLLIVGVLPFWERIRTYPKIRSAMLGINAVVVGLLLSAFYNPVWTSAIYHMKDVSLAALCFLLLTFWKTPSWIVVLFSASVSGLLF